MTAQHNFEDTSSWLKSLTEGRPVAIVPTPMAAEALGESAGSLSKKIKTGTIPSIAIGGKRHLSADWVHGELVRAERQFEDMRAILERVARRGSKIFYSDLMAELGMNWQSPPDRTRTGALLGRISRESMEEFNIFLSAIVHRKTAEPTHPGPGYTGLLGDLVEEYDGIDYDPEEDETELVARHMEQVYAHYQAA